MGYKIIDVKASIFDNNNKMADLLREDLKREGTYLINLMSSPGSGKTSTLVRLINLLDSEFKIGVMEADIDGQVDASRIEKETSAKVIQLHSGGLCHLDSEMTRSGLNELGIEDLDLVILENIGNLVCPAEFDTGAIKNMMILSIPEGDDKPLKYPLMFSICDTIIVNKIDAISFFDFKKELFEERVKKINENAKIFYISAKTKEGIEDLANHLKAEIKKWKDSF